MNLFNIYKKINEKRDWWNYYGEHKEEESKKDIFPIPNNPIEFIKGFFVTGGKKEVFDDILTEIKSIDQTRAYHIISTFLLGIELHRGLKENIPYKKIIEDILDTNNPNNGEEDKNWLYTWFLTCLYHDIGYVYEENKSPCCEDLFSVEELKYCKELDFYDLGCKYLAYRRWNYKLDHGVIGGFRLYAKLKKTFEEALEVLRKNDKNDYGIYSMSNNSSLKISRQFYKFHKIAADAIVRHNMWIYNKQTEFEYRLFGLGELNDENKIAIDQPFCFLLALCDTLEPLKRYKISTFTYIEVLENLQLEVNNNRIVIKASKSEGKDDSLWIWMQDYFEKLQAPGTMEKWLHVKVNSWWLKDGKTIDKKSMSNEDIKKSTKVKVEIEILEPES